MKKHILSLITVVATIILLSCSKSSNPTPSQNNTPALDSVKSAMTGKWNFASLTITQISSGITATTTSCATAPFQNANFTDNKWLNYTYMLNFIFINSSSNNLTVQESCNTAYTDTGFNFAAAQNSDGSINLTLYKNTNPTYALYVYNLKTKDITTNTITVTQISYESWVGSVDGYLSTIKFTRQ